MSFITIAVAAVLGAWVYFAMPALVPSHQIRAQIDDHISHWTGGAYRLHEDASIAIKPGLDVIVSDAAFAPVAGAPTAPLLTSDQGTASIRIVPLLFGRVEIANLALSHPNLVLDAHGTGFLGDTSPQPTTSAPAKHLHPLGAVTLTNGTVRLSNAEGVDDISDVNLHLSTNETSDAVALKGSVTIGGRQVRVDLHLDDMSALMSDAGTQGRLNLRIGPQQNDPDGNSALSDWGVSNGATDKMLQLASAVGMSNMGLGAMTAEGTFSVTPQSVGISDATFSLGGVEMNGSLHAGHAEQNIIAQLLRLPDVIGAAIAQARETGEGRWSDIPLQVSGLNGLVLDLNLSGDDIALGNLALDDAAVSLSVRDGTATLDLAGGRESLGALQAGLTVDYSDKDQLELAVSGRTDEVSVSDTVRFLTTIGPPPLVGTAQLPEGTMNGTFDLTAQGPTVGALVDSFSGSVQAQLTDGSLAGTDLVATLETLVRGRKFMTEQDGPLIPAAGRTRFDQLDAQIDFAAGEAIVSGIHIAGDRFGINMLGEVQLAEGRMNVGGDAVLLPEPGGDAKVGDALVNLPFGVGGTVFEPVVAAGVPTVTTAQVDADAKD
ncbi:AsmA family protein [Tateyamaria sp. SN3-11]|uniref:AsmA family protein n=1 Tax=Tateyamaria sp. SN3-11 TaxID=3092147 RepID=UPI0039E76B98